MGDDRHKWFEGLWVFQGGRADGLFWCDPGENSLDGEFAFFSVECSRYFVDDDEPVRDVPGRELGPKRPFEGEFYGVQSRPRGEDEEAEQGAFVGGVQRRGVDDQ